MTHDTRTTGNRAGLRGSPTDPSGSSGMVGVARRLATVGCVLAVLLSLVPTGAVASAPPTASFTYSPAAPTPDDTITFDASASTDPDGQIVTYNWYVGGGEYADGHGETFTQSFDEGGSHTITLEVEDDQGNVDRYRETVTVENPAPEASISYAPTSPNPDETISFTASGSTDADGRIVDYHWYVGTQYEGSGENFDWSFDEAGAYTVSLEVEDNGGKTDRVAATIVVENDAPTATFSYTPEAPHPDQEITFDASGSSDADGRIVDYDWYVEDNWEGSGQTFSYTFGDGGARSVRLVVTDNGDTTRAVERTVNVTNSAPIPAFTTRSSPDGLDVTFDASASADPDGRIVNYGWYVGDDWQGSGQTFTYTFDEKGPYQVTLVVTDNGDVTRELTKDVAVSQRPTADIDYAGEAIPVNRTVELSAAGSCDHDGSLTTYVWTLPDGST